MKKSFFPLIIFFIFLTTYTPKFDLISDSYLSIKKIHIEGNSTLNSDDVFDDELPASSIDLDSSPSSLRVCEPHPIKNDVIKVNTIKYLSTCNVLLR